MNRTLFSRLHRFFATRSLALRLAVTSALVGALVTFSAGAIGYFSLASELKKQDVAALEAKRSAVESTLAKLEHAPSSALQQNYLINAFEGHDDMSLAAWDSTVGSIQTTPVVVSPMASKIGGRVKSSNGRDLAYMLIIDGQRSHALLLGYTRALMWAVPAVLLLVVMGAWLVATAGLLPLKRFVRLSASINTTSLANRMQPEDFPAEIKLLADDFNRMLARLEDGVSRLSQFSDDLAHEIRTPLANAMGRAQVALSRPRSPAELADTLASTIEDMEHLSRLVADMLFLARAENQTEALQLTQLNLADESETVAAYLDVIAADTHIKVVVTGHAETYADKSLVQRAITNLLSNALRHGQSGSRVTVEADESEGASLLRVKNIGAPIRPEQQVHLFDRFYRVDSSRDRREGGSGMGLAIVAGIMQLHSGRATVQSASIAGKEDLAETVFTLYFPARK